MAQSNNYKALSILTDDVDYEKWKKEIKIWRTFTLKKENFMAPFYGWGSTASRLEPFR